MFRALPYVFALLASFPSAHAQVYKWVDEKGVTHYGERSPAGKTEQAVPDRLANPGSPNPPAGKPGDWSQKEIEFRKRQLKKKAEEEKLARQEASAQQACKREQQKLDSMRHTRRPYELDGKGERVYLDDKQREDWLARQQRQVSERCRK